MRDPDARPVPDVSVVIPAYNAEDYVGEAIRSVLAQTIAPERLELIVVDDGSTDGSGAVIAELAREDPRITLITQENSGTPGGGRNPGIGAARGTFLFFLDSDDLLPEGSLERMVDVAIEQGSDVVLGRLGSTDGRRVPSSMFTRTVLDADLLKDRIFQTLGPTKLIRRELVERLGLRFPTDQTVGEDQPFMAAVYLNASRISVLADTDYYLTRYRTDGANMTLASRDSASFAIVAMRVAAVVEQYTEPGPRRDALLLRPFRRPLAGALGTRWLAMERPAQEALAEEIRSAVGHLYTERLRTALPLEMSAKLDLLLAGDLDGLALVIQHVVESKSFPVSWDGEGFRRVVPAEIDGLVSEDLRRTALPKATGRLEDLAVERASVSVAATLTIPGLEGAPDALGLRLRLRGGEDVRDLEILRTDLAAPSGGFLVRGRADRLPRGVWDLYAVLRFVGPDGDDGPDGAADPERAAGLTKEIRIGADRSPAIDPDGASNLADDPEAEDRLLAYFTKGQGNLSIDSGAVLHRNLALARGEGLLPGEDGAVLLLVRTSREPQPGDAYSAELSGSGRAAAKQDLPPLRLGDRLIGLRLPISASTAGTSVRVSAVLGGIRSTLPITGIAHWPEASAGFGLQEREDGWVEVLGADGGSGPLPPASSASASAASASAVIASAATASRKAAGCTARRARSAAARLLGGRS